MTGDNMASTYSSAADDSSESDKRREAFLLFAVAEGHLQDGEDPDEGIAAANDALASFREVQDKKGIADTLRLLFNATRMKAEKTLNEGNSGMWREILNDILVQAEEEMIGFQASGDKRSEAAMLLSMAEANQSLRNTSRRLQALECALDAADIAKDIGDQKLEALAMMTVSTVNALKKDFKAQKRAVALAIELFKAVGDRRSEAHAFYNLGSADINSGRIEEGMRSKNKALKIFLELGDIRLAAGTWVSQAEWLLEKEDWKGSLHAANEAIALLEKIEARPGDDSITAARYWMVQAHLMGNDVNRALEVAEDCLARERATNNKKNEVQAMSMLAETQAAANKHDEALKTAMEGQSIARDELDKRWEAYALECLSQVHYDSENWEAAKNDAIEAVELSKDLDGFEEEAFSRMQALTRVLVQKDEYAQGVKVMEEAKQLATRMDDKYYEAMALMGLCGCHAISGNFDKAETAGRLAAELFREEGYARGEARAWKALADCFMNADYAQSVRFAKQGEMLMQEFGDFRMLLKVKRSLAEIHMTHANFEAAAEAAMQGLKIARTLECMSGTVDMIYLTLDARYWNLNDENTTKKEEKSGAEKCLRLAKEAMGLSVRRGDKNGQMLGSYWIGVFYLMLGKLQEACKVGDGGLVIAREVRHVSLELRLLTVTVQANFHMGEKKIAMKDLELAGRLAAEKGNEEDVTLVKKLEEALVGVPAAGADGMSDEVLQQLLAQRQQAQLTAGATGPAATAAGPGGGAVEVYKPPDPSSVKDYLNAMVKNMTGGDEVIEGDIPLMESGIDSLASVELRTQLQQEFRLNLPSTVMFNYPTVNGLKDLIVEECTNKQIPWSG